MYMDSELLDTKILSKILIENHSKILKQQNEEDKLYRDQKIRDQIQEASKYFIIKELQLDFYAHLNQNIFISEIDKQIIVMIVFNYDYPKSKPQIFATKQMSHRLIDSDTWQIKVKQNDSLIFMMNDIKSQFLTQAPEGDFIEDLTKNKDDQFYQQIKAIQNVELRQLFGNPPTQFNEKLKGDLTPFIMQLEAYQNICQLIVEKAQKNNVIGEFIQQIMNENEKLHSEVNLIQQNFSQIQLYGLSIDQLCQTLAKNFSDKELARVLDKKIQILEQYREEKYENKVNEEDEKKFEQDIKEYLVKRKEYQISIQKRQSCLKMLQNKYKK